MRHRADEQPVIGKWCIELDGFEEILVPELNLGQMSLEVGEFYDGVAPYGQFYRDDIRYFGAGFSLTQ